MKKRYATKQGLLAVLTGNDCKVYLGMRVLHGMYVARHPGSQVFSASLPQLVEICDLSRNTVSKCRTRLEKAKLLQNLGQGAYRLLRPASWDDVPSQLLAAPNMRSIFTANSPNASTSPADPAGNLKKPSAFWGSQKLGGSKYTTEEKRDLVARAMKIMGIHGGVGYIGRCLARVTRLLEREEHKPDELIEVARWADVEYRSRRYAPLQSLQYVWGIQRFAEHLALAKTGKYKTQFGGEVEDAEAKRVMEERPGEIHIVRRG